MTWAEKQTQLMQVLRKESEECHWDSADWPDAYFADLAAAVLDWMGEGGT